MKQKVIFIGIVILLLLIFNTCTRQSDFPVLKGPYLGQKPPGNIPELFMPGIISTNNHESKIVFAPDGNEILWSVMHMTHNYHAIVIMEKENDRWTKPEVAPFSGKYMDADAVYSFDGSKLFFTSKRPAGDADADENYDIWFASRSESGWGEPKNLGLNINTDKIDVNPCLSKNGTLYFSSNREGGKGSHDIYYSLWENGRYTEPVNMGDSINTSNFESSPYIAPDESYLIYNAFKSNNSESGLHISFRKKDGTWTKGKNMGKIINDTKPSMFAYVTYDQKYLFFTSQKVPYLPYKGTPLNFEKIIKMFNSPQNGSGDIYWVDAKVIDELKPDHLK